MLVFYIFLSLFALSILLSGIGTCIRLVMQERHLDRAQIAAECIEIGVFYLNMFTYPFGFFQTAPRRNNLPIQAHRPIILVPGYGLNRLSFIILKRYLQYKGYPWVWSINHPVRKDDIPAFAEALDQQIRWYCHYTKSPDVTVIGHSMGGIVSALAIQNHQSPIAKLITLGTPWKGTKMHIFGIGKHVRQLAPLHPIITEIKVPSIPHLAIWTKQDWILLPTENAIREGIHHTCFEHIGHFGLLIHHPTFQCIHNFLHDEAQSSDHLCHR